MPVTEGRSGMDYQIRISVESLEPEAAHKPSSQLYIQEVAVSGGKLVLKKTYRKTNPTTSGDHIQSCLKL